MTAQVQRFSVGSMLKVTRFWNLVIIAFCQYFTAWSLIDPQSIYGYRLFLLVASTVLIAAAGYVINDYYDVKIDLINKPDRVVIGRNLTRRYAILIHTLLSVTGVAIGLLLGWRIGLVNFVAAFLLWLYSNLLKRQPFVGNFTVALLTGMSVEIVSVFFKVNNHWVTIYALFAFYITLIREIVKDMEDLRGDHSFGCKTLPIVWGIRRTKVVIYGLIVLFTSTVMIINYWFVGMPMLYLSVCLFLPMGLFVARLVRADTIRDFYSLSAFCKVIMVLGIVSMAFVT